MGKCFWPVYIATAAISCALVWRFAPAIGAHLPHDIRARICHAVESNVAFFSDRNVPVQTTGQKRGAPNAVVQQQSPPDATKQERGAPDAAVQEHNPSVRSAPIRTPAQRGVRPVDPLHAKWGVLTGITPVQKLDGSPVGNAPAGRFFKIKDTITTPSGLMVTGTFIPQKMPDTVRIPTVRINCFSGAPSFLSTNQQFCLRKYYELTGEAETVKERFLRETAKKYPFLQDAADALRELRAREKAAKESKNADADTLRKMTYEISQLRVKVQELNQKHRDWKAEHSAEMPDPEKDPAYLEIIGKRCRYAEQIPGLTL